MNERTLAVTTGVDFAGIIDRLPKAASTKEKYKRALARYLDTGGRLDDPDAIAEHAATLPASGRSFLKAALGHVLADFARFAKSQARPENVADVQAALWRAEAIDAAIETPKQKGSKVHVWLSANQVRQLLATCGGDLQGQRDRLVLGLLVAAGLRRSEAVALEFADVVQVPVGDGFRSVLAVKGKGGKRREVPISDELAQAIDKWGEVVGGDGRVLRSLGRRGEPGERISAQAVADVVKRRGAMMGKPELACHDLRRSYAQLGLAAGVPITQISRLLGHSSVATTQKYLDLSLDLETTISDFVPF